MIDSAFITIIPPVVAAILTYIIANRRARIQQAKLIADIQVKALQTVTESEARNREHEDKLRKEIWDELHNVKRENDILRMEILDLRQKLTSSNDLIGALKEEISSLRSTLDLYRKRIVELETK